MQESSESTTAPLPALRRTIDLFPVEANGRPLVALRDRDDPAGATSASTTLGGAWPACSTAIARRARSVPPLPCAGRSACASAMVSAAFAARVERAEREMLDITCQGDAEAFHRQVMLDHDARRIYGLAPIYIYWRC